MSRGRRLLLFWGSVILVAELVTILLAWMEKGT